MVEILNLVAQIADTEATILVYGESGTGKELIARAIHENSSRCQKPLIPLNCGALAENLLEAELFGHVRGAFTGAHQARQGWFECARGGTIFLDEIHTMSSALQTKLLRILQTGDYSKVGSTLIQKADVRIVAATTLNLRDLVQLDKFNEELFYRLDVIEIMLPPLRERMSDLSQLIQHFLKIFCAKYKKETLKFSKEAENLLYSYDYPGNIRELRNIIERIVILSQDELIFPDLLPARIVEQTNLACKNVNAFDYKKAKKRVVEKFEREFFVNCLQHAKGNVTHAAHSAGIHITHFYTKIKQYDINPHNFKADL